DLPPELVQLFVEQNGQVGRLIYVKGSPRFSTWNVADRVAFAHEVRAIALPPGVVIGGEPLVIADIVESMETDAPLMIVVSIIGSLLVVWLVVGLRRHGLVTMVASIAGVVVMIAACALAGLRVHFLDLIALPITIGIGIDYAVNLAARDQADVRDGHPPDARRLLASTGAAVLLCSFTTTVGYGSLLLSSNGGVRAFGLAAILGELSCIAMALLLAPTLLGLRRR
ncbi:MAG: MMPL family transporter, partial [Proteobacteria bacterium]|nr:MMPL family transporter [Pseudomonadota bacterium]